MKNYILFSLVVIGLIIALAVIFTINRGECLNDVCQVILNNVKQIANDVNQIIDKIPR